jgi:hypothetical protein
MNFQADHKGYGWIACEKSWEELPLISFDIFGTRSHDCFLFRWKAPSTYCTQASTSPSSASP